MARYLILGLILCGFMACGDEEGDEPTSQITVCEEVTGLSEEQVAEIVEDAEEDGLEIIDETDGEEKALEAPFVVATCGSSVIISSTETNTNTTITGDEISETEENS